MSNFVATRCTKCGGKAPHMKFHKGATQCVICRHEAMAAFYAENKGCLRESNKASIAKLNQKVFSLLGDKCIKCGEKEIELLTVDHVNNDRQSERSPHSYVWKHDLILGKVDVKKYQIMCRNCNEAKQRLNPTQLLKLNRISTGVSKTCARCKLVKDSCEFSTSSYRGHRCLDSTCSQCTRLDNRMTILRCHSMLGGECVCCGERESMKLHIDHKYNDGGVRRRNGEKTGVDLCRQVVNGSVNKTDYQLLCANCNYSKFLHDGVCIHTLNGSRT